MKKQPNYKTIAQQFYNATKEPDRGYEIAIVHDLAQLLERTHAAGVEEARDSAQVAALQRANLIMESWSGAVASYGSSVRDELRRRELSEKCVRQWSEHAHDWQIFERSDGTRFTRRRAVDAFGLAGEWSVVADTRPPA